MTEDDGVIGGELLADGMNLSIRLRRDFTVTDADQLLTTARRIYRDLNPGTSVENSHAMVSCAADALFVLLEHAGLLGDAVDNRLQGYVRDGLKIEGWRAQIVPNEPWPLAPGPRSNCMRGGEVFALPPDRSDD